MEDPDKPDLSPPEKIYVRMAELWFKLSDRMRDLEKETMERMIEAMVESGHDFIDSELPKEKPENPGLPGH